MSIFSIFVRQRVFALMLNLAVVVVGVICYFTLGVDLMPKINVPIVSVTITMPGAPPEVMEQQVTRVVEDAVAVIGGLDSIQSTSTSGSSSVVVQFNLSKDVNLATQEVRDQVNAKLGDLPTDIQTPVIQKYDPNAMPVISVVLSGADARALSDLAKNRLQPDLQSIDGVGQVQLIGERKRQIRIEVDHDLMQAYGVTVTDVRNAVGQQNKEAGGGSIRSPLFQIQMRTMGLLTSAAQFDDIIVKTVSDYPVKLRDVGTAIDGLEEASSMSRFNDTASLTLQVVRSSDANTTKVVEAVRARIAELRKDLPKGVEMVLANDVSVFIRESVNDIIEHLVLGSALASLMVLLFLGDLRSTVIATVAIPCSIIGGFIVMAGLGYTLNQITLLALALAVGIVIDDAVVVLEEIHRLMDEEGLSPKDAAEKGIQSIGFAVLATTLSLVVIFLPIAFMPGILGAYFSSYGILMAATIMLSMFVSFTFTPMLCAVFLKPKKHAKKKRASLYEILLERPYTWLVRVTLRLRFLVVLLCLGIAAWGFWLLQHTGRDFIQAQDDGTLTVNLRLPPGSSLGVNDDVVTRVASALRAGLREVDYTLSTVGGRGDVNNATITIQMKDWEERAKHKPVYTVFDAQTEARKLLARYPAIRSTVNVGSQSQADMSVVISGPDLDTLQRTADTLMKKLQSQPGYVDVDTDLDMGSPEVRVYVDRERAAFLGVNFYDAASTVQALVGGIKVSSFYQGKERIDVNLRLKPSQRERAAVIDTLSVPNTKGDLIPMINVVRMERGLAASTIKHYARQRQVTVSANLVNVPLQSALDFSKAEVQKLNLGADYQVNFTGNGQYMNQMLMVFLGAFLVSVVFMYMVLASQFESFLDPAIILATLPLCFPFALLSLQETHNTLNMFAVLGLFLLVGVVKKNAIFQIDTTNAMVAEGRPLYESIIEANRIRLRPIIMTTVTLVVAMAPVAAAGANGWTRAPMAIVIVGGQALSLVLTLIVVPALYSYAHDFLGRKYREEVRLGGKRGNRQAEVAADAPVAKAESSASDTEAGASPSDTKAMPPVTDTKAMPPVSETKAVPDAPPSDGGEAPS